MSLPDRARGRGTPSWAGTDDHGAEEKPAGLRERAARHALLPLRLFLGVTFLYAGLDKMTDPDFLSTGGPGSLGDLLGSIQGAAAPWMLDLAQQDPVAFGYAIALGETAVGLGALAGLWTRLAALGGALISLSFWLTISWNVGPYYYSQDAAYLAAWTPLLLAGAPTLSLDAYLAARRARNGHGHGGPRHRSSG
ncbi:DoxX family protein [Streptomyces sp. TRM 70361]|uniref:DoxX family protein n=1 Tax=Streptomyces sp. TRM 70361 TaxID=3116553 RepID=UPI002E7B3FD7|nr:DoxX family protein [Streptomyces sp. TRM 70361]MEE1940630.1 DoxX family protein [Streptomyces sp. TRM 70361]